jgi:glycosyltransferase involved in cell wall biosynthesis
MSSAHQRPYTLGIDASRNRSGGAIAHLTGILSAGSPIDHGFSTVHVWSYRNLLDRLPERPWLVKHAPPALEAGLPSQLLWQATSLRRSALEAGCDVLFTTDASTFCRFSPSVVLSQDMLSYEPGVMASFGYGRARARLLAILFAQNAAFRRADGVIFLTRYVGRVIQESCGRLSNVAYVPHGVDDSFRSPPRAKQETSPVKCVYVSNAEMYKHQWVVVEAIELLRKRGHPVTLDLIGGGDGPAQALLDAQIRRSDPHGEYVTQVGKVPSSQLPALLSDADIFVFASSCENMPVTLLEGMACGLPIACSDRGPMPEVLEDGGVFFDPENPESVAAAIEQLLGDPDLRMRVARRAHELAGQYTWARCADETFDFIAQTVARARKHR